jgi:hypothetical protein
LPLVKFGVVLVSGLGKEFLFILLQAFIFILLKAFVSVCPYVDVSTHGFSPVVDKL